MPLSFLLLFACWAALSLSLVCSALFPWTKRNSSRNGWEIRKIQGKKERNGREVFNFSSSSWDARGIKLVARAESRDKVGCVKDTIPKPRYIAHSYSYSIPRAPLFFPYWIYISIWLDANNDGLLLLARCNKTSLFYLNVTQWERATWILARKMLKLSTAHNWLYLRWANETMTFYLITQWPDTQWVHHFIAYHLRSV